MTIQQTISLAGKNYDDQSNLILYILAQFFIGNLRIVIVLIRLQTGLRWIKFILKYISSIIKQCAY
jgi:hypothetical protein